LLSVSLVLNDHDQRGPWNGVLLKPGEVTQYWGLPTGDNLVKIVVDRFESRIIQDYKDRIKEVLVRNVPVRSVTPSEIHVFSTSIPVQAALPLTWEVYCGVANSQFMIKCHWGRVLIEIDSDGTGGPYKDPNSNSIQGIIVEYKAWQREKIEQHLSDLNKSFPFAIYFRKLNDWEQEGCSQTESVSAPDRVP
jgi:hypothetical protein